MKGDDDHEEEGDKDYEEIKKGKNLIKRKMEESDYIDDKGKDDDNQ
jgi:hypothetical protein